MRKLIVTVAALMATPAFAAKGPFLSLGNTDFVVLLAFIGFVAILLYAKVPRMLTDMLDKRAADISAELKEARALREDAQSILAEFERKQAEVKEKAEAIVTQAREEAELMAVQAKADLEKSIARRVAAAEDQIASAEQGAVREVRNTAITVSVAAARDILAKGMDAGRADALIDAAIADVGNRLH